MTRIVFSALSAFLAFGPARVALPAEKASHGLEDVPYVVFALRAIGEDPHWYANFGYWCEEPDRPMYTEGARLCRLDPRTGIVRDLVNDPRGSIRDPQVHYDAERILFSYRRGGTAEYHLFEIGVDGTGLRQLTDGAADDIEPAYLPDGGIVFTSSRCNRFVNCWFTRVATLHRCNGDGSNVRMLSSNNDHDNTPWVLPDGRVLYMRWEYVDRSQVHFHHLWTMNPDGTGQMVFYGNQQAGVAMLDAKPMPGSDKLVASFSPGHGRKEHMGHVTVVDPAGGPDLLTATQRISKGPPVFRDPYPLSGNRFLVASRRGILVMDTEGRTETLWAPSKDDAPLECHEPRPVRRRTRERVLPSRVDLARSTGRLVLADIYRGRKMRGVKRGEIKKLLVLEQLPEPVHFSGGMEPLSIGGTFTMARALGTVPVEPDGSAYMDLPALRSIFLVALDEKDLSVKRMQSFLTLQPGEFASCGGCHENRERASPIRSDLMALGRAPSRVEPIPGVPDVIDYPRDVQPILDRRCVECHDARKRAGGVELTGDHTPSYSVSYWAMVNHGLFADGRNQPYSNRAPRTIGSSASKLMALIDGSHHGAKLTPDERAAIRVWIDTSATYPGTYAALGSGTYPVHFPATLGRRCGRCHSFEENSPEGKRRRFRFGVATRPNAICNLTNPRDSLILRAPLAKEAGGLGLCREDSFVSRDDAGYTRLLAAIEDGARRLREGKRFDMPGFRPNEHYIREMQRFGILGELRPDEPVDVYATDRAYWRSFWHRPEAKVSTRRDHR